jgi:hypothetical protein
LNYHRRQNIKTLNTGLLHAGRATILAV